MSLWKDLLAGATKTIQSYKGDTVFLKAATAACANVIAADGEVEDAEVEKALKGLMDNKILKASYTNSQIDEALTAALANAKTRAGRIENTRAIEAMATKGAEAKQDVFLIAADCTDGNSHGGIGEPEKASLKKIAAALGIDGDRLLAAA